MQIDAQRAARVEARTEDYIHRAKRMILELFGIEASHEQTVVTMQLATAMIHLDAAATIAEAIGKAEKNTEVKGA